MKQYLLPATIFTFILGAVVVAIHALGYIDESILMVIVGLLGFGGLAELRLYMETQGFKTYAVIVIGALGIAGLLTGYATPAQVGYWYSFWGIISGGTLAHAVAKSK
jgi:hypothetical protein